MTRFRYGTTPSRMNWALLAILFLLGQASASAQSTLITTYDRFEDRTTVRTPISWVRIRNRAAVLGDDSLILYAYFTCRGRAGNPVDQFALAFASSSRESVYLKNAKLNILVDGKRTVLAQPTARDSDISTSGSHVVVSESLIFVCSYSLLRQIADAKKVEMRLGPSEFQVDSDFMKSVTTLLDQVQFPSNKPSKKRSH